MASTGNSESVPYLGSKISIISKCEIRYEGILYTVDTKQATIALAKVKCLGTESRLTDKPVGPREEIYEYIIFKAVDIKDLTVCETPQPVLQLHGLPFDPAILEASQVGIELTKLESAQPPAYIGKRQHKSRSENVDPNKQPSVKQHAQQNHLNNSYGNSGNHSEMLSSLSHQQSMQHEQRQSIVASTMHNGVIDYRQLPLSTSTTITSVAATTETGVQANVNIPPILRNQTRLQPVVTKEVQQRSQYGTTYHAHIEAAMPPRRPLISDHEKYIAGSASEPSRPTSRERPHVSFSLDDDASRNEAQKRLNRSSDNALMTMGRSPQLYNRGSVNFQGRGRGVANGYNRGFVRSTSVPLNNTFNAPSDNYQRRFGTTVPTSGPSYNHNGVNHNGINGNNNSKKDTPVNFGNDSFPHPYQGFFPPPPPPAAMANFFNRSFDFGMLGRPTNPLMATAAQQYRGGFIPPGPGAMRGARGGMRYFVPRGTAHVQPRYRKALLDNSWSRDGKPTTTAKEPELKFDTDFDFEEANAKFVAEIKDTETKFAEGEKLDEASEIKPERSESTEAEKENPTDKENEASAPSQDEQANGHRSPIHVGPLGAIENKDVSCTEKPKKFYDRETSFFDNISCEFENRVDERKPLAVTRQRTRDLNKETFGTEFATRFNGPPRGRGMGPRNVNGRYFQPNRFNPRGYGSVQEYRHANVYRGRWMGRPAYPLVR